MSHAPPVNGFKAVVFDFDATLTALPEIPRHRLFPGFDDKEPDHSWMRDIAFGGAARLDLLLRALSALQNQWGSELYILSFAEKATIVRTLELIGALDFFGEAGSRVYGWEEFALGFPPNGRKGTFLAQLVAHFSWRPEDVLFLDDQPENVRSAANACQAIWVRGSTGMSERHLDSLCRTGGAGLVSSLTSTMRIHSPQQQQRQLQEQQREHDVDVASHVTDRSCSTRSDPPTPDEAPPQGLVQRDGVAGSEGFNLV